MRHKIHAARRCAVAEVCAFSNRQNFGKASLRFCSNVKFIRLPQTAADEILPLAASCARYLLAAHARHSPYPLAASRRFTNVHRCRLSPASSRIFLCLVSRASAVSALRRVFQKHANLSCIKFRFFAVLTSCCTLSCLSAVSRRRAISLRTYAPHSLQVLADAP